MINWSWLIVVFLAGILVGSGVILVPMMKKAMKNFGKK